MNKTLMIMELLKKNKQQMKLVQLSIKLTN